jgi:hypothetical protein
MPLERLQRHSRGGVPEPDGLAPRSGRQQLAVRREGHGADPATMPENRDIVVHNRRWSIVECKVLVISLRYLVEAVSDWNFRSARHKTYFPFIDLESTTSINELMQNIKDGESDTDPNGYFQRISLNANSRTSGSASPAVNSD